MAIFVVLATSWDRGDDPVNYYSTNPNGCLNFSSAPRKPRSKLREIERGSLADCEYGVKYDVVVCKEIGQ